MSRKLELIKFINQKQKELFSGILLTIKESNSIETKVINQVSTKNYGNWEIITIIKKIVR